MSYSSIHSKVDKITACSLISFLPAATSCHLGGWGLVKEQPRLNVGFSRPQDQFYSIGDIHALRRSPHHQAKLDELTEEERSATIALETRHDKDLQGAFDCYGKKGVIVLVEPENHDEAKLVDLSAAEHFRRKLEAIHRGEPICRQE